MDTREKINQCLHQCNLELGLDTLRLEPRTSDEIDSVFEPIITKWTDQILSIFLDQTRDDCPSCKGKGYIEHLEERFTTGADRELCPACNGTGKDPNSEWHLDRLGNTYPLLVSLAHIASNLGRGTFIPSEFDNGSRPLRIKATEALKEWGLVYKENPDGWYKGDILVVPM